MDFIWQEGWGEYKYVKERCGKYKKIQIDLNIFSSCG